MTRMLESLRNVEWVDLQVTDLLGVFHHVTVHRSMITEEVFRRGIGKLDGSSVHGFKGIEESDLVLRPVAETWAKLPWFESTGRFICMVYEPGNGRRLSRDPRLAAENLENLLKGQGYSALVAVEPEFFVFDRIDVRIDQGFQAYRVESSEAPWSDNRGVFMRPKEGYYPTPPQDKTFEYRLRLGGLLRKWFGIEVQVAHHEVATAGQMEVNFEPRGPVETADRLQTFKYAARVTAYKMGLTATFMPKPIPGDNGSGLHIHMSLWKGGENVFYDEDDPYAELSQEARYFIGGLLEHARSLAAITNPTVNSYRRLVPGFEAPVYIAWSRRNRSAMVRIPYYYGAAPSSKRVEFRSPDPSSNPYLAVTASIMAGLDGIKRKIEPGDPVDRNLYAMSPGERRRLGIKQLPRSLWEALDELESDSSWLRPAFTKDMVETYIEMKREEARKLAGIPSPAEAYYYLSA